MKKFFLGLCAFFLLLNIPTPAVQASTPCHTVMTIFARGSGAPKDAGEDFQSFKNAYLPAITKYFKNLDHVLYDLDYPAVGVASPVALGAFFNLDGKSSSYAKSINLGITNLTNLINSCPDSKFVLAGYSQGAEVISTAIHDGLIPADRLIYAATFGDPKIYLPEGASSLLNTSAACRGQNLSNYRIDVPNCHVEHGLLGKNSPYQTAAFIDKIGTWCHDQDFFCGSGFNSSDPLAAHLAYKTDGSYANAANYIVSALARIFPPSAAIDTTTNTNSPHDIAILIDTTGSMDELIDRYRTEAKNLANKTYAIGGRVALYEYRDLSDPFAPRELCDLSCSQIEFETKLDHLTTGGGGDIPESALSASLKVMNSLKWQHGANKSVIILTDSSYLSPDRDGTTLNQIVTRSLEIDPVNFYIITPPENQASYLDWANLTGGQVFSSATDLALSTDYVSSRPVANLALENYSGAPGEEFFFDATGSSVENLDHFEWDLDLDGNFEYSSGVTPTASHTYSAPTTGFVQVKIVDSTGRSSTMSARVTVSEASATHPPALSNLKLTYSDSDATFIFEKSANTALILVTINGEVVGFTHDTTFTIKNLPENEDVAISFVPINSAGKNGDPFFAIARKITTKLKVPNAGF